MIEFKPKACDPTTQRGGCIVLGVFQPRRLGDAAKRVDETSGGALSQALGSGDMDGSPDQSLVLHRVSGLAAERVLLVGCGRRKEFNEGRYRKVLTRAFDALRKTGARDAVSFLDDLPLPGRDVYWKLRQVVAACRAVFYRFDQLKTKKESKKKPLLRRLVLNVPSAKDLDAGRRAVQDGVAIADGVDLARQLGNLPPNICTPSHLAAEAERVAGTYKSVAAEVLDEAAMAELGMGALLSVSRGSREPARLITVSYRGASKSEKPVVLVGKGVTFDSGGISIKPSAAMDEMKFDMCGAASVLGAVQASAALGLPVNVTGIIPATENLPDGNASKPGNIVTSMSGQSIEILNTDAEGRLILCDALTYAKRFEPDVVIDIATLTGACVVALGAHATGLFTNYRSLGDALIEAGQYTGDRAWELPLWEDYQESLKSNFADFANIGGRDAGAVTAACFLSRFTKDYRWAHLDIAGAAWTTGSRKGATGRPVPLLVEYLLRRARAKGKSKSAE